jgi:excisionase family DNA binding protein
MRAKRHDQEKRIEHRLHMLLTVPEVAELLRTSRNAVYALSARGELPGVTRIGRRLLVRRDALLHWLDQKDAPSPKEFGR